MPTPNYDEDRRELDEILTRANSRDDLDELAELIRAKKAEPHFQEFQARLDRTMTEHAVVLDRLTDS